MPAPGAVAEPAQEIGQLALGPGVHHVLGADLGLRVHPHVQWPLVSVAETPVALVELTGADPEVEEHPAHLVDAQVGHHLGQLVEAGLAHRDTVTERRQPGRRRRHGVGVAVDADEGQVGVGLEHGGGVATVAQGGVDVDPGRHLAEEVDHAVDQHRVVDGGRDLAGHRPCSVR